MSAEASSSTQTSIQVDSNSYKITEEYSISDISNLSSHTYPQMTHIHMWNDFKVLKVMALEMPIVEFLAKIPEPKYPPLSIWKPGESAAMFGACMKIANAEQSCLEAVRQGKSASVTSPDPPTTAGWLVAVEAREEQLTKWKQ
uniref:Uncharacterized protein n=1 Tax=Moniliophthora roreri TaxID=221103 RepID=A0A0W0F9T7_MONRR